MPIPIVLSWSSGKDSAWTLYQLQHDERYEVVGLLTTINKQFERVAMHAVRLELLRAQAAAANLPLQIVELPWPCSNEAYAEIMTEVISGIEKQGIGHMAFGDLYLQDIRDYRETQLANTSIEALFPLWQLPTKQLAQDMIDAGLVAHLSCVDPSQLAPEFCGRRYDQSLLNDLPDKVDPCGENGEFHSFVSAGPMFEHSIDITVGERVERDGFVFTDLTLA